MKAHPSLISHVAAGKRRREVLLKLKERSMSQPELRKITGMYKSHISRTLSELLKDKLIVCLNPKDRAFKFYKITPLGLRVLKEVNKLL